MSNLLRRMRSVESYDFADGSPAVNSGNGLAKVGAGPYNPGAVAQIQLQFIKNYYTWAAGVYTPILPAALDNSLKVKIPFFAFNNMDAKSGFAKSLSQMPVAEWVVGVPFVFGFDQSLTAFGALDANAASQLRRGDLVIPFTKDLATDYVCLAIIRMTDSAYSSLLDATNSNGFVTGLLRYTVQNDAAGLAQYAEPIMSSNLSMFGKYSSDPINPDSYKNPEQQQPNIVDLYIKFTANKQTGLSTYLGFDVTNVRWNIFIDEVVKVL